MNNGKICVSVCAETADELIEQIKRAEDLADVIEIRFDCLNIGELDSALSNLPVIKNLLATFRTKEQGGKRPLNLQDRLTFWQKFLVHNKNKNFYADFEADTLYFPNLIKAKTILSYHFFDKIPSDLTDNFTALSQVSQANIVKIALQQNVTGVINCCSGEPVTVKAFVENYLDKQNQKITLNPGFYPYPDYESMHFWGDVTKLKSIVTND